MSVPQRFRTLNRRRRPYLGPYGRFKDVVYVDNFLMSEERLSYVQHHRDAAQIMRPQRKANFPETFLF